MRFDLRRKTVLMVLCFVVAPVLILGLFSSALARHIIAEKTDDLSSKAMDKAVQYISSDMLRLCEMSRGFAASDDAVSIAAGLNAGVDPDVVQRQLVRVFTSNRHASSRVSFPVSYLLATNTGQVSTSLALARDARQSILQNGLLGRDWYTRLSTRTYTDLWVGFGPNWLLPATGEDQVMFASNILRDHENLGVFILCINQSYFSKMMTGFKFTPGSLTLLLEEGRLQLPSRGDEAAAARLMAHMDEAAWAEDYVLRQGAFSLPGVEQRWTLYMLTPLAEMHREANLILWVTLLLLGLAIVCAVVVALMINRQMVRPLLAMNGLMDSVRRGDLTVRADAHDRDEIGRLGAGFNQMAAQLEGNIERIRADEENKRQLELRILQAQIDPHFIRNTLNTVRWMAELKKAAGISRALASFIRLIDYSFRGLETTVPLREEVDYLGEYLYLQRLRYQSSFQFELECPAELEEVHILKLLVQPIVENGILHGLGEAPGFGRLVIRFELEGDVLLVRVEDDGRGMAPELAAALATAPPRGDGSHIGVGNVAERIRLHYGEGYGLHIESAPGRGTRVLVRLPAIRKDAGEGRDEHAESSAG